MSEQVKPQFGDRWFNPKTNEYFIHDGQAWVKWPPRSYDEVEKDQLLEDEVHSVKVQNEMAELIEKQAQELKSLKETLFEARQALITEGMRANGFEKAWGEVVSAWAELKEWTAKEYGSSGMVGHAGFLLALKQKMDELEKKP